MNKILELKDLNISVAGKHVVKGIGLELHKGEIMVIMGPNGSGKSTLANGLMGHPSYVITGDILLENIKLPEFKSGDILAIMTTGAYGYSMSSNYNKIPKPAVVMVKDSESRLIFKRESYEDLLRYDIN